MRDLFLDHFVLPPGREIGECDRAIRIFPDRSLP
jgi:hypothetical protein